LASKHNLNFVDAELDEIKEKNLYRKLRYGVAEYQLQKLKLNNYNQVQD
jgi:hypothetical protein